MCEEVKKGRSEEVKRLRREEGKNGFERIWVQLHEIDT
jgi:hypothetical protein